MWILFSMSLAIPSGKVGRFFLSKQWQSCVMQQWFNQSAPNMMKRSFHHYQKKIFNMHKTVTEIKQVQPTNYDSKQKYVTTNRNHSGKKYFFVRKVNIFTFTSETQFCFHIQTTHNIKWRHLRMLTQWHFIIVVFEFKCCDKCKILQAF